MSRLKTLVSELVRKPTPFAFTFPGQGSQYVGMGKDLNENYKAARLVFEEVNEALGFNLSKLMFEGDFNELTSTENAQPALLANSIATLRAFSQETGLLPSSNCSCVLGHSLGEFSAMVAADVMPLSLAAQLVRLRGASMKKAVRSSEKECGMMALMPINQEKSLQVCKESLENVPTGEICEIANVNGPQQIVLSGTSVALEQAAVIAKSSYRVRRVVKLDVSAPFHCSIMEPAAKDLNDFIEENKSSFSEPIVPVVSNVTGEGIVAKDRLLELAVQQVLYD